MITNILRISPYHGRLVYNYYGRVPLLIICILVTRKSFAQVCSYRNGQGTTTTKLTGMAWCSG